MIETLDSELNAVSRNKRLLLSDHVFSCVVIPNDDTSIEFIKLCNIIIQHLYQTRIQVNFLPEIDRKSTRLNSSH